MSKAGWNRFGIGGVLVGAGILLGFGCERTPAPVAPPPPPPVALPPPPVVEPPPPPPPAPLVIPLQETSEIVRFSEIQRQPNIRLVRGDFNPDGHKDVATVRELGGQEIEITVFLGRKEVDFYSRAGVVRRPLSGKVVGFLTSRPGDYMDLVILVGRTNGPNEVIHFRNDGTRFEEIQPLAAEAP